jgi:hypothetical protein
MVLHTLVFESGFERFDREPRRSEVRIPDAQVDNIHALPHALVAIL